MPLFFWFLSFPNLSFVFLMYFCISKRLDMLYLFYLYIFNILLYLTFHGKRAQRLFHLLLNVTPLLFQSCILCSFQLLEEVDQKDRRFPFLHSLTISRISVLLSHHTMDLMVISVSDFLTDFSFSSLSFHGIIHICIFNFQASFHYISA